MSRTNALSSTDVNGDLFITPRKLGPVKPQSGNKAPSTTDPLAKSTRKAPILTPGRSGPMKGIGVKTPAHPKAPSFSVFTDNALKLDISDDEEEDFGPIEKMGEADDHTDFWEARFVLNPKYENVILTEPSNSNSKPSELFLKYDMAAIDESEEFDLDAFDREYADILENLRENY